MSSHENSKAFSLLEKQFLIPRAQSTRVPNFSQNSMLANFSINQPFNCGLISNDWRQSPTAYASGTEHQNASIIPITSYSDANRQFKSYNLAGTVQYLEKVSMLAPYIS